MSFLRLILRNLAFRKTGHLLTILTGALGIALVGSIISLKQSVSGELNRGTPGVDLLIGKGSSPLEFSLFMMYNFKVGAGFAASGLITEAGYEKLKAMPEVKSALPIYTGDSYKGYRVNGTTTDFFSYQFFRYRKTKSGRKTIKLAEGKPFTEDSLKIVAGSDAAAGLNLKVGTPLKLAHGASGDETHDHDSGETKTKTHDTPFEVSGIMAPTGTALDRGLFLSLEALHKIHEEESPAKNLDPETLKLLKENDPNFKPEAEEPKGYDGVFIQVRNAVARFHLPAKIETTFPTLMAVPPKQSLEGFQQWLEGINDILITIALMVVVVSAVSLFLNLFHSVHLRLPQLKLYRSHGARRSFVIRLLFAEGLVLLLAAVMAGIGIGLGVLAVLGNRLGRDYGFDAGLAILQPEFLAFLIGFLVLGQIPTLIPAYIAYRRVD